MHERESLTFAQAVELMQPADLLLARGTSWFGRGIKLASLSEYTHAAMVGFRGTNGNRIPVLLEVVQWKGGRGVDLEDEVNRYPGVYDLYLANAGNRWPRFERIASEQRMWKFRGVNYGWWSIAKASFAFLPVVRLLQKVDKLRIDDQSSLNTPPFCSMACAIAYEAGGVDPVTNLRHSMTTPGHLSQSLFFEFVCTLVP